MTPPYKASFERSFENLGDLEGLGLAEDYFKGYIHCSNCSLTSLKGMPRHVGRDVNVVKNDLKSLEFCPNKIDGDFYFNSNKLTSLQGIHKLFKDGYIQGEIQLTGNPIKSHLLGLLLIPRLTTVFADDAPKSLPELVAAIDIINRHLEGKRDIIDCQQELIAAGLKAYAQL